MAKPPTKNDVIKKYLLSDLERFFKRLYRYNQHELVYSRTLPSYELECPGIVKDLRRLFRGEFPDTVVFAINVHRVMVQYYGFIIDLEDITLSHRISQVIQSDYDKYHIHRYRNKTTYRSQVKMRQAYNEMLARGFVHINDFEGYDKDYAHITSNVSMKLSYGRLYYPMNFTWDAYTKEDNINQGRRWFHFADVYHIRAGVRGYSRVLTPLDR